jgi:hypothetical protein
VFLSSLLLFSLGTCTNASQPNTLIFEIKGFLPDHTSCGFVSTSTDKGDVFTIYFVVLIASAQNSCVSPTPLRMCLVHQCSFHSLSNSIFLWGIWCGVLACYATLLVELLKLFSTLFTTIVGSQHLNLLTCLVLYKIFKLFEFLENI